MTSRDFCYWLQGYFEVHTSGANEQDFNASFSLNPEQVRTVRRHLAMVFQHEIDPSFGGLEKQKALDALHHGLVGTTKGSQLDVYKPGPYSGDTGIGIGPSSCDAGVKMRC